MAQQMTFAAVAKLVGLSWHRAHAICSRHVDLTLAEADLSTVRAVAIDETSCRRGHNYLTIAKTITRFAEHLTAHKATSGQVVP